jgi:hypothetical protein
LHQSAVDQEKSFIDLRLDWIEFFGTVKGLYKLEKNLTQIGPNLMVKKMVRRNILFFLGPLSSPGIAPIPWHKVCSEFCSEC